MIQDIEPKNFSNTFIAKELRKDSKVIGFRENQIYLKWEENQITYLTYRELTTKCNELGKEVPECCYLFSIDEEDFFLADLTEIDEQDGFSYYKMFETRTMKPKELVLVASTAWHLYVWYRDNQFCGRCGHSLVHENKMRALRCPDCDNMVFPKIAPAVIVAVTNGDKIMMTKYAGREYKKYALIAGFTEIGETAEQTVEREVMEEVGIKVKNIRYYKSQPWGFDSNLLLGYFAELDGDAAVSMDEDELAVAEWVDWRDIPEDPEGLSLTREMMTKFHDDMEAKKDYTNK